MTDWHYIDAYTLRRLLPGHRDVVRAWIRAHDVDLNKAQSIEVGPDALVVTEYVFDNDGKILVRDREAVTRERRIPKRGPFPPFPPLPQGDTP